MASERYKIPPFMLITELFSCTDLLATQLQPDLLLRAPARSLHDHRQVSLLHHRHPHPLHGHQGGQRPLPVPARRGDGPGDGQHHRPRPPADGLHRDAQ